MARAVAGARALAVLVGTVSALALAAGPGRAQEPAPPRPSVNLYGQAGLIDLPGAEAMPDGEVSASWSVFGGQQRRNLTFQILPRLAGTVRFASIANFGRPGEPGFDLTDRSFDLTWHAVTEEGWRPSLAVGLRDVFGTGVYSSEFVVASKRVVPAVTVSAGIGWGRLASSGGFENPFCAVAGGDLCDRADGFGGGSGLATDRFFRGGRAALFGGVEWRTPVRGLTLKAEYSPDAYERERQSPEAELRRRSGLNLGAEYRLTQGITLGGYWMYGDAVGVQVAVSANPRRPLTQQNFAPGPLPVSPRAPDAPQGRNWATDAALGQLGPALAAALDAEGVTLEELRVTPEMAEVRITNRRIARDPQAIGRVVRVLQVGTPASVETFRVTMLRGGLPVTTVTIPRAAFEGLIDRPQAGERLWEAASVASAAAAPEPAAAVWRRPAAAPAFGFSVLPSPWFAYTGRDDPLRAGVTLDALASLSLTPQLSFSARLSQPVAGLPRDPGPVGSALQPVRTDTARYFAGTTPNVRRLTADYVTKVSGDVYLRASGGYLERMFAGVSGEVLWKPSESPVGLGLELNWVAQRDRDGLGFGQYDYQVTTGHASIYWDTGFRGVELQLDAGRYLAGDWGATLRATRRFANGWAFGAFATFTDVSSRDFGEGGFDKGVTLEIPLRWAVPFETRVRAATELRTATRDGGARLGVANRLYPTVRDLDRTRLERNWGAFWQ